MGKRTSKRRRAERSAPVRLAATAAAAGLVASAITAGPALGAALVGIAQVDDIAHLSVAAGGDSPNASHGMIIEPIVDSERWSYRVRQDTFGAPTISGFVTECATNPLFNDVLCNAILPDRSRYAIDVTMQGGDDRVALFEQALTEGFAGVLVAAPRFCPIESEGFRPVILGTVQGGGGNDTLRIVPVLRSAVCPGGFTDITHLQMRFSAEGGAGMDRLTGGALADTLRGGPNADVLDGGVGGLADLVLYDERTNPVTVTIGAGANDGEAGEGDEVLGSVEFVRGGQAGDTLSGDGDVNDLKGNGGPDTLSGRGGGDTLTGDDGADFIVGGTERDTLRGGTGADTIVAREPSPPGVADDISCGEGLVLLGRDKVDSLTSDLEDPRPADCEQIEQFALDDGPPGRALGQRLRVGPGGRVAVKVACPRRARTACRGVLRLRPAKGRRVLGRARYRVRLGRRASVSLRIRRRLPHRIAVEMVEQGVSKKGPRFSSRLLRVKR